MNFPLPIPAEMRSSSNYHIKGRAIIALTSSVLSRTLGPAHFSTVELSGGCKKAALKLNGSRRGTTRTKYCHMPFGVSGRNNRYYRGNAMACAPAAQFSRHTLSGRAGSRTRAGMMGSDAPPISRHGCLTSSHRSRGSVRPAQPFNHADGRMPRLAPTPEGISRRLDAVAAGSLSPGPRDPLSGGSDGGRGHGLIDNATRAAGPAAAQPFGGSP